MGSLEVSSLKHDTKYESALFIDDKFLLLADNCTLTAEKIAALKSWGFKTVETKDNAVPNSGTSSAPAKKVISTETQAVDLSEFEEDTSSSNPIPMDQIPDKFKTSEEVDFDAFTSDSSPVPAETAAKPIVKQDEPSSHTSEPTILNQRSSLSDYVSKKIGEVVPETKNEEIDEDSHMAEVQAKYDEYMEYITKVYTHYATHKEFDMKEISDKVLELCNYIRENKNFILRLSPSVEARNKNFLISHSMRTTIYSIVIGQQLKMPYTKLVDLGVAAILHEIGQIRLPPQLYMNENKLSNSEFAQMQTHTVLGYNIIKEAGFSLPIQLGVLEHHERETGTGYPRKLTGDRISPYAKIIAVACSYEAITAPRHFKEAKTTFEGMVEMLKNQNHLYDDTVVKALLYSLSLFPIGAYVYLSNGNVGQVVDVSPVSPKNPIVQVIGVTNPDGTPKTFQTGDNTISIVRVMNNSEVESMKKNLKQ